MTLKIKSKEATAIINSLSSGVVPRIGVQHITVGRKLEIEAFTSSLDDVKNGHSMVKFWIGDFGSGKSFMLHLLNIVATKQKFVVANADLTPDNRLYSNDGKAVALYSSIMDNVAIQTKPEGGALPTLLDKWIEQVVSKTSDAKQSVNWINGELSGNLNKENKSISESPVSADMLAGLINRITDNTISGKIAKEVFNAMWSGDGNADAIIDSKGLKQITDSGAIETIVDEIIAANPDQVEQYKAGKGKVLGFFVGQAMKASKGKANPAQLNELLKSKLSN